jgi:hypothetical protein
MIRYENHKAQQGLAMPAYWSVISLSNDRTPEFRRGPGGLCS